MVTTPRVSVILNCYNHEAYVAEAIESVLAQSFADFELIVIDNGSTDGTREVIEAFADPRIHRILHDTNETLSRRLNQGMAAARGELVCVLYSDDYMLPDKLERQVAQFAALPASFGVVYGPALRLNQFTKALWQSPSAKLSGRIMPALLQRYYDGPPDMSSPLTRRVCHLAHPWHEDIFGDGEGVFLRIALGWDFHFDPAPTVVLRDHHNNMGKAVQRNHDLVMIVLDRLGEEPTFLPVYRRDLARLKAVMCRNNSWIALRMGTDDTGWVRRQLAATLRISPRMAIHPRWLGGAVLALLPGSTRGMLNAVGRKLKGTRENVNLVADY